MDARREYQSTEFWAVLVGVALYLADRHLAGGLLEHHADLAPRARDVAFQVLAAG